MTDGTWWWEQEQPLGFGVRSSEQLLRIVGLVAQQLGAACCRLITGNPPKVGHGPRATGHLPLLVARWCLCLLDIVGRARPSLKAHKSPISAARARVLAAVLGCSEV
jgi:hypothetical protein